MSKITITTKTYDGIIEQEVFHDPFTMEERMRTIIDTKETQVIKALTDLGWTPPIR